MATRTAMRIAAPNQRGYSMLEGLTILLLASIVTAVGIPSLSDINQRSNASAHMRSLIASLHLARTHAITKKTVTTLCPSNDGLSCGGDWNQGWLLFRDEDDNRQFDQADHLLEQGYPLQGGASLNWRASGGRNTYIRFTRFGAAKEFGTFTYCPASRKASEGKMLVLNRMGRLRLAKDANGDGIVENYNGQTPQC